jgi:hypothetical protein
VSPEFLRSLREALTRNMAFTTPGAADERLQGRTYAVPFDEVWTASLRLVDGGLSGWKLVEADDEEGIIRGLIHGPLRGSESALTLRIGLDADAQTRVDGLSASTVGRADLGANARRLGRFFKALDRALAGARGERRAVRIAPLPTAGSGATRGSGGR